MKKPKSNFLVSMLCVGMFLCGKTAFAAEPILNCQWIETTGEAAVENITPEEARQLALNRARIKAIEGVSDVHVHAITLVKNLSLAADFIQTLSSGYVLGEKDIEWSSKAYQEKKDSLPLTIYTVKLKSCVAPTKTGDPYFKIKGELNRLVFIAGEDAKIKATCTKDCYLTIINLTADDKAKVLLPNEYEPSPLIRGGETYNFPAGGLGLEMYPLAGHKKDSEVFILIATKERFDLLLKTPSSQSSVAKGFNLDNETDRKLGKDILPKDLYTALLSIPADNRAEEILAYEVVTK